MSRVADYMTIDYMLYDYIKIYSTNCTNSLTYVVYLVYGLKRNELNLDFLRRHEQTFGCLDAISTKFEEP